MVKYLRINKSTITFKLNLYKLIKKKPKLRNSTVSVFHFKNRFEQIKLIFEASGSECKSTLNNF